MSSLKGNICVFTGSRPGRRSDYANVARQFGRELVDRGYGLVYGGGNVGLMTVVADTVLECQGHVTGVIPETLVEKEVVHRGLSDLRIVQFLDDADVQDFLKPKHRALLIVEKEPGRLLDRFEPFIVTYETQRFYR